MMVLLRAVALCAGLLLVAAAPAAGAFPGANGKIVFLSARDHPGASIYEIYVANADGSAPTRLTHDGRRYSPPSFSPDGRRIVFGSDELGGHIFVMDADGTDRVQLTSGECGGFDPAFSPDGSRVAFVVDVFNPRCPEPDRGNIAVMDADGANRSVSDHGGGGPVWAPDGSRIAFTHGDHIDTMSPAGGDLQTLTPGIVAGEPDYSPDGSRIVFTGAFYNRFGPSSEIYVMDADGSDYRRLTFNDDADNILFTASDSAPVCSPDGTKIAYSSRTHGPGIHVMNADGTNITLITCGGDLSHAWGPLVAPSDAGSGVICDADADDDGVNDPSDGCPRLPAPATNFPPGCPKLVAPTPTGGTPANTGGGGSTPGRPVPPAIGRLLGSLARELAQAGTALERCGTTGLHRKSGCRDSFTALAPGFVVYRLTAPAPEGRAAAVAVIASGKRAIPAAGSYPVKVKSTKKGRKRLRKARKLHATLTVSFTDSTGNVAKRSKKVVLRRKKK